MLAKAERDEGTLECGVQWPLGEVEARALARSGRAPNALHNNCSGKHAGFICLSCAMGVEAKGYIAPDHDVQREVAAAIEVTIGVRLSEEMRGVDGCAIPTCPAVPLSHLRGVCAAGNRGRAVADAPESRDAHSLCGRRSPRDRRRRGPVRHRGP